MSKVSFFCSSLGAGGAERVLSILSKNLADNFSSVEYIMWYDSPVFYKIDERVRLVSVENMASTKSYIGKMRWFRQYIKNSRPDLLVSFSAPFNMIALASTLGVGVKVVAAERVDPRSFHWGKSLEYLRNILYRGAAGILAQTDTSKNYFKGKLWEKTDVIFNPVFMNSDEVGCALKSKKRNVITTASRICTQKRLDVLIETFSEFKKRYPDYMLEIYGEGPERPNLEKLVKNLRIEDSVYFCGKVSDIWNRIKTAKIFVMTTLYEGMSNSLIEAMCLGLPCISTKVSGATDLIQDGKNGYLIEIDDKKALLEDMCLIAADDNLSKSLGEEASKTYERLNVDTISREWIDYITNKMGV